MTDLIKRTDAIDSVMGMTFADRDDYGIALEAVYNTPAAKPKRGEWKPFDLTWGRSIWYCTACEEGVEVPCDIWTHKPIYNYCPNCGADMRGVDNE